MDKVNSPYLSAQDQARQRMLLRQRTERLINAERMIDRRTFLRARHAPRAWIDRITSEIQNNQRHLEIIELELDDILQRELKARRDK